jgi:hypothetical protein
VILANRGVITFAAWLNIAHATGMTIMSIRLPNETPRSPRCISHFRPDWCSADCAITSKTVFKRDIDRVMFWHFERNRDVKPII